MENVLQAKVLGTILEAVNNLEFPTLRTALLDAMASPRKETRIFQTGRGDDQADLWIFHEIPKRKVGLAYSEGGYGLSGLPWGLVFLQSDEYGGSGSWYSTLELLLAESGYFEMS